MQDQHLDTFTRAIGSAASRRHVLTMLGTGIGASMPILRTNPHAASAQCAVGANCQTDTVTVLPVAGAALKKQIKEGPPLAIMLGAGIAALLAALGLRNKQ